MGIIAKGGKDFDPVPQGMQHGICYAIYELGTQVNANPKFKDAFQVLIMWEMPEQRIEIETEECVIDMPRAIARRYTLSLFRSSNLRKHLESWRGKAFTEDQLEGFDITVLLGINCDLQIIHNKKDDKTFANINTIVPFRGEKREPENPTRYYSIKEHGENIPADTPDWVENLIKASKEWEHYSTDDIVDTVTETFDATLQDEYPQDETPPNHLDDENIPF